MWQRIPRSEAYRGTSPTQVRRQWAFSDFLDAYVLLDVDDREALRRQAEAEDPRGR